jgi:hypothetical protein
MQRPEIPLDLPLGKGEVPREDHDSAGTGEFQQPPAGQALEFFALKD